MKGSKLQYRPTGPYWLAYRDTAQGPATRLTCWGNIRFAWLRLGMPTRDGLAWCWWVLWHGAPKPLDLGPPAWLRGFKVAGRDGL